MDKLTFEILEDRYLSSRVFFQLLSADSLNRFALELLGSLCIIKGRYRVGPHNRKTTRYIPYECALESAEQISIKKLKNGQSPFDIPPYLQFEEHHQVVASEFPPHFPIESIKLDFIVAIYYDRDTNSNHAKSVLLIKSQLTFKDYPTIQIIDTVNNKPLITKQEELLDILFDKMTLFSANITMPKYNALKIPLLTSRNLTPQTPLSIHSSPLTRLTPSSPRAKSKGFFWKKLHAIYHTRFTVEIFMSILSIILWLILCIVYQESLDTLFASIYFLGSSTFIYFCRKIFKFLRDYFIGIPLKEGRDKTFFVNGWNAWSYAGRVLIGTKPPMYSMPSLFVRAFHHGGVGTSLPINLGYGDIPYVYKYSRYQQSTSSKQPVFQTPIKQHNGQSQIGFFSDDYDQRDYIASDMFTSIADLTSKYGFVCGFISQKEQFGCIAANVDYDRIAVHVSGDGVIIPSQSIINTDPFVIYTITHLDDPFSIFTSIAGEENKVHLRSMNRVPSGWCSWYHFFQNINEDILLNNIDHMHKFRLENGLHQFDTNVLNLFQIDDGYQHAWGDWTELKSSFSSSSNGFTHIIRKLRQYGLEPGIWLAPFASDKDSKVAQKHPEWILYKDSQRKVPCNSANCGKFFYGMDITHPGYQNYLRECLQIIAKTWTFKYLKLDFLYASVLEGSEENMYDPTKTKAQIIQLGMGLINDCLNQCVERKERSQSVSSTSSNTIINNTNNNLSNPPLPPLPPSTPPRVNPNTVKDSSYSFSYPLLRSHSADRYVNSELFILGCGAPLGGLIGHVDGNRISADAGLTWNPSFPLPSNDSWNLPCARNMIRNTLNRLYMHKKWWINDPDCLILRDKNAFNIHELRGMLVVKALSGGSMILSDDFNSIPAERFRLMTQFLPPTNRAAVAIDCLYTEMPELLRLSLNCTPNVTLDLPNQSTMTPGKRGLDTPLMKAQSPAPQSPLSHLGLSSSSHDIDYMTSSQSESHSQDSTGSFVQDRMKILLVTSDSGDASIDNLESYDDDDLVIPTAIQVQTEGLSDSDNSDLSDLEIENSTRKVKKSFYSEFEEVAKQSLTTNSKEMTPEKVVSYIAELNDTNQLEKEDSSDLPKAATDNLIKFIEESDSPGTPMAKKSLSKIPPLGNSKTNLTRSSHSSPFLSTLSSQTTPRPDNLTPMEATQEKLFQQRISSFSSQTSMLSSTPSFIAKSALDAKNRLLDKRNLTKFWHVFAACNWSLEPKTHFVTLRDLFGPDTIEDFIAYTNYLYYQTSLKSQSKAKKSTNKLTSTTNNGVSSKAMSFYPAPSAHKLQHNPLSGILGDLEPEAKTNKDSQKKKGILTQKFHSFTPSSTINSHSKPNFSRQIEHILHIFNFWDQTYSYKVIQLDEEDDHSHEIALRDISPHSANLFIMNISLHPLMPKYLGSNLHFSGGKEVSRAYFDNTPIECKRHLTQFASNAIPRKRSKQNMFSPSVLNTPSPMPSTSTSTANNSSNFTPLIHTIRIDFEPGFVRNWSWGGMIYVFLPVNYKRTKAFNHVLGKCEVVGSVSKAGATSSSSSSASSSGSSSAQQTPRIGHMSPSISTKKSKTMDKNTSSAQLVDYFEEPSCRTAGFIYRIPVGASIPSHLSSTSLNNTNMYASSSGANDRNSHHHLLISWIYDIEETVMNIDTPDQLFS